MSEQEKPCCDLRVQHTHGTVQADGVFTPDQPPVRAQKQPPVSAQLLAAEHADWQQVVLNGGPPCFHYEPDRQRFCLRAERWEGHDAHHTFVSLATLIEQQAARIKALEYELETWTAQWEPAKHSLGAAWKERADVAEARCTEQAEEIARLKAELENAEAHWRQLDALLQAQESPSEASARTLQQVRVFQVSADVELQWAEQMLDSDRASTRKHIANARDLLAKLAALEEQP